NDLSSTLNAFGYQDCAQQAMIDIYSKYRDRFFVGRAWYYALTGLVYAPMSSKLFKSINESPDIEEIFGRSRADILERNLIGLYILYVLDPGLPLIRFDERKKDFDLDDIKVVAELAKKYTTSNDFSAENIECYGS